MDLVKKFLILLAIFCVIGSAAAVSAVDLDGSDYGTVNDESGDQYGVAVDDDSGLSTDENPDLLAPDINHHEPAAGEPQGNETSDNETGDDIYAPDVSNTVPVSEDLNMTNQTGNATDNATSSATSPQTMLATGNPILALLAVGAVLGGAAVIKRK